MKITVNLSAANLLECIKVSMWQDKWFLLWTCCLAVHTGLFAPAMLSSAILIVVVFSSWLYGWRAGSATMLADWVRQQQESCDSLSQNDGEING